MKKLAIAIALVGIILMLTERNGGPWAGTVIGIVMMCAGATVLFHGKKAGRDAKE